MTLYEVITVDGANIKTHVGPTTDYEAARRAFDRLSVENGAAHVQLCELFRSKTNWQKPSKSEPKIEAQTQQKTKKGKIQ